MQESAVKLDPIFMCSHKNLEYYARNLQDGKERPNSLQVSKILARHTRLFARNCIFLQQDNQHNLARYLARLVLLVTRSAGLVQPPLFIGCYNRATNTVHYFTHTFYT